MSSLPDIPYKRFAYEKLVLAYVDKVKNEKEETKWHEFLFFIPLWYSIVWKKFAAWFPHNQSKYSASKDSKVWITTNLSFTVKAGYCSALDAVNFIAPVYFFKWDLTACTPRESYFINLELVKLDIFIPSLPTLIAIVRNAFASHTDPCTASMTKCLVLATAGWLLDDSVAIRSRTPHFVLVKGYWLIKIQLFETIKNFGLTQPLNVFLIIRCFLITIHHHTWGISWLSLCNASL